MRLLADSGLTTREACGNTVRNVTACPVAGICPGEAFDVTPYALGVSRYLLRHPDFHDLPRKFKIAFSGCEDDGACAVAGIHDVGLIAQVRGNNGTSRRGFKVLVGGGLGSLPTEAAVLTDFLPEEELLPTIEAVLRVFTETGNRKNKLMARLKFVLRAKGIEEFRRLVAESVNFRKRLRKLLSCLLPSGRRWSPSRHCLRCLQERKRKTTRNTIAGPSTI